MSELLIPASGMLRDCDLWGRRLEAVTLDGTGACSMCTMLTVHEAAASLRRSPETIRRWIRAGRLRAHKVGTQYLIEESDLSAVEDEALPIPAFLAKTSTGEAMPDVVTALRRSALAEYMAEYEAEHGEISDEEMGDAVRAARARAVVVRGTPGGGRKRSAGGGRGRR